MRNRSVIGAIAAHTKLQKHYGKVKVEDPNNYDKAFIREQYHTRCVQLVKTAEKPLTRQQKEKIYDDVIRTFY